MILYNYDSFYYPTCMFYSLKFNSCRVKILDASDPWVRWKGRWAHAVSDGDTRCWRREGFQVWHSSRRVAYPLRPWTTCKPSLWLRSLLWKEGEPSSTLLRSITTRSLWVLLSVVCSTEWGSWNDGSYWVYVKLLELSAKTQTHCHMPSVLDSQGG